jgi:hypothetical protein
MRQVNTENVTLRLRKDLELREYLALPKRHEEPSSNLSTWDTSLKGLHGTQDHSLV